MARAVAILALAGAGWWAYQNGHLAPLLDRLGGNQADTVGADTRAGLFETMGGPSPVLAANDTGIMRSDLNKEQRLVWDNSDVLSGWSKLNPNWTAAMIWVESRGNVKARGPKTKWGHALGPMQVLPGTAKDLYGWGWNRFSPTQDVLLSAKGGVYFGSAYLEYLSRKNSDREWITKAYHGGPAGEAKGMWGPKTQDYLAQVSARYKAITKGEWT